ncbi:epiplakin [Orycteropus afer afer]|uniref:Epiplakin n=1 Tax=Orycteropus afer afer TaxID=1230840 RepID=A0A8B7B3M4_ORYAF|nr:epiplakin [Orycteropus afer afer]
MRNELDKDEHESPGGWAQHGTLWRGWDIRPPHAYVLGMEVTSPTLVIPGHQGMAPKHNGEQRSQQAEVKGTSHPTPSPTPRSRSWFQNQAVLTLPTSPSGPPALASGLLLAQAAEAQGPLEEPQDPLGPRVQYQVDSCGQEPLPGLSRTQLAVSPGNGGGRGEAGGEGWTQSRSAKAVLQPIHHGEPCLTSQLPGGAEETLVTQVTQVTETVVAKAVQRDPACRREPPALVRLWAGGGEGGRAGTPGAEAGPLQAPPGPLAALRSWMDGMEELQASQGPPAPNTTAATAQLREQEVEPRLRGAQGSVELRGQWERLVQRAEARWGLLRQLVPGARSFEAACGALLARLGPGERLLAELQQSPLQPGGCLGPAQRLQFMGREAAARADGLEQVLESGQRLAALLDEDEARLVRAQLAGNGAARVRRELLRAPDGGSLLPSPPAAPGAWLELQRAASDHPGLKNQEQLHVQLAQLADRLEQLAWRAERTSLAGAHPAPSQEQPLPLGSPGPEGVALQAGLHPAQELGLGAPVLQAEGGFPGHRWSEAQEQDSEVTGGPAQSVHWGPVELAVLQEDLQPEGWLQATQVPGLYWRPDLQGGTWTVKGTGHPGLLLGCRPAVYACSVERPPTLEETLLFLSHLVEELLALLPRLCLAVPWGTQGAPVTRGSGLHSGFKGQPRVLQKPGCLQGWAQLLGASGCWLASSGRGTHSRLQQQVEESGNRGVLAQPWGLLALPGALGAAGLKCWTGATGQVLALRGPNQRRPDAPGRPSGVQQQSCSVAIEVAIEVDTDRDELAGGQRPAQSPGSLSEQVGQGALMVRVGGGWVALDEFLVKNEPGRGVTEGPWFSAALPAPTPAPTQGGSRGGRGPVLALHLPAPPLMEVRPPPPPPGAGPGRRLKFSRAGSGRVSRQSASWLPLLRGEPQRRCLPSSVPVPHNRNTGSVACTLSKRFRPLSPATTHDTLAGRPANSRARVKAPSLGSQPPRSTRSFKKQTCLKSCDQGSRLLVNSANQSSIMNGHTTPPLDVLVTDGTNGTEVPRVSKTGKAMPGAGTPSTPLAQAAPLGKARSIAGVCVEASGQNLSVYTAMKQGLLPSGLGLALLEAQAATGGLVDPSQGQLLPVSEALRQGLVGLELKEKLLTAERAVTGYPDPYGGAKLPLFQAIGKEVVNRALGRSWLEAQLATGGLVDPTRGVRVAPEPACQQGLLDQKTWHSLEEWEPGSDSAGFCDPNTLERLPYRELLSRCVEAPGPGLVLLPLKTAFRTLSGAVGTAELLEVGVLDEETARGLREGLLAVPDVSSRADVKRYLEGTGGVGGVVLLPAGHKKSLSQAAAEHLLPLGTVFPLLEAQAATRTLVDPATGRQLWVDEAVRAGLVGPKLHGQLLVAEQAVTGFHDPFSTSRVPLFQAMKKGLVDKLLALRLLDAQLATGGLMCPARRLRLPLEAALRFGCLDEETQQRLSQTTGFSDPSTQESLSYGQLLTRCVTDPETGLAFLPLMGAAQGDEPQGLPFIEHSTRQALSAATATVSAGKFQGRPVSLWELLFSEAVPAEQRAALAKKHKEGTLSTEALATQLKATVEQAAAAARVTFTGLRDAVTPGELLESEIIDRDVYEQLERGQATAHDVGHLDSVQRYLQGTGSIAGLLLPGSQERLSIWEARSKSLLRPGTALVLLEAQAATGFIIDPKENKRYSVDEALRAGVIGPDVYAKLLSAERAVTGYKDPYTGQQISLFQAMQKDLIVRDHGIRLLEAQIATGGVIDPVHSHRVPVEVAYQRGYFDRALNLVLSDPSDDTKGFFDPNTHENLTYLQLLERCVRDPDTGLCLLPLSSVQPQLVDSATRQAFQGQLLSVQYGRFRGQRVSLWELVNSEYICEDQRRQLLREFRLRKMTLEQVTSLLQTESQRWAEVMLPTLRGCVPAYELLEAGIIDEALLGRVLSGAVSPKVLLEVDTVRRCLRGSGALGGVLLQPSNRRLSVYQAMQQKLLGPGMGLALLEAQAATGALLDPQSQEALTVDEAVHRGLVGPELYSQLRWVEHAVTGFRDPFSGKRVSVFQAMKKGLVPREQAARLLEAQVATGGIIDPAGCYHLPMPVAAKRGCVDREMEKVLSDVPQTFPSPDGRGRTSYSQLLEQCPHDEASGLLFLPLPDSTPTVPSDEQLQEALQAAQSDEDGKSLWDLLGSSHFTEQQRQGFLEDFRVGRLSEQELRATLQSLLQAAELRARAQASVPGPRGKVPAVWLLDAGIISQDTLEALAEGRQSSDEVARQPAVRDCLWGTGCVAGVLLQPSGAKASIARAMQDGLLPVGLGQRLLEAQVACGTLVNPVTNQRLSVEDAVKFGLVGGELSEQLRLTERTVAGFPDPCSGRALSLWQAVEQGLVPRAEGLPLLQAQLATGGIMDPIYHTHLPLPTACRLGLLDEATGQALSSTDDSVKFFFDPGTQDKVTYQELRARCVQDAATSLWLLPLSQDTVLDVDEHTAVALRAMKVPVGVGRFKGQAVSLWDLLRSEYVTAERRRELVALCQSGRAAALREVVHAVTMLIEVAERQPSQSIFRGLRKQVSARDLFRSQLIDKKTLDELTQGKRTVQEVTEMASVRQFLEGGNFIAGVRIQATGETMSIPEALRRHILRPGTALVLLEAQAATGFVIDPVENRKLTVEQAYSAGMFGKETYEKLLSAERIDPVHSHRVPVEVAYQRGYFDEDMNRVLSDPSDDTKGFFDPNTHENLTYLQLLGRCVCDPDTGLYMLQIVKKGETYVYIDEATKHLLGSSTTKMHVGRFAGQTVSLWDMLSSQYFSEERRRTLVQQYKTKKLSLERLLAIITETVEETEKQSQAVQVEGPQGPVSAAELFNSGIIDKETLDALQRDKGSEHSIRELVRVKRFLDGRGCIAGVSTPSAREVMSVYEASRKELLPTGIAALLLEAQAATGFMLDPRGHQRLPVDEAVAAGLVGAELRDRLLNAQKAAQGHAAPGSGTRLSLFQAMEQKLVPREDALRLLEVQVATGGILDPLHGHRVPLETAFRRGLLNQDTYVLVSDQKLMKKRFVDPNTRESATYQQLQARCQMDEATGWVLLPVGQDSRDCGYVDEATRKALEAEWVEITVGRYRGQRRSVWELLNSEYMTEEKKQELVAKYRKDTAGALGKVVKVILDLIAEQEDRRKQLWFPGIRRQVTASELFHSDIISKDTLEALEEGRSTVHDVLEQAAVRRYLQGTSCIAGVLVPCRDAPDMNRVLSDPSDDTKGFFDPNTHENLTYLQLLGRCVSDPDTGLYMLQLVGPDAAVHQLGEELRAALRGARATLSSGVLRGQSMSVWELLFHRMVPDSQRQELLRRYRAGKLTAHEVGAALTALLDKGHAHRKRGDSQDPQEALRAATMEVHVGQFQGRSLSVWDVLWSSYVCVTTREELLAQFGSGALTLPELTRRLTVIIKEAEGHSAAQSGGHQDGTARKGPSTAGKETETIDDANAEANTKADQRRQEEALRAATMQLHVGQFQGQSPSVWDVLWSSYLTETRRQELLAQHAAGTLTLSALVSVLTQLVEKMEERLSRVSFRGLRRQVSASELCKAKILGPEILWDLAQGTKTLEEVAEMDSVRRYLQGTSCIAGVLVPCRDAPGRQEKMSIYQAMWKGVLRPGTALVLLEAQAATGFIIDPVGNRRLSVEEAVAEGVVGGEVRDKLLSAERAVTGYKDPYTGQQISLFQAMQKDLIVRDHGIRLLEAQIATGGVIDPVHSHRVPVEVAYQRGYFDEDMNRVLSDPSDDTKGFFDPNTHENLTYLQLLERCVRDPDTGLLFLSLSKGL